AWLLSASPPTMAVLPSAESATDPPWAPWPTPPVPTSFVPCWVHAPPLRVKTQAAPVLLLSPKPPTMAVLPSLGGGTGLAWEAAGRREGAALEDGGADRTGADQLAALLGPPPAAAGEYPRRPGTEVVVAPAHDGGVAVGGERDGETLVAGGASRAGANQLGAL